MGWVLLILVIVGGCVALYVWCKAQREKSFREVAGKLGCRLYPHDPHGLAFRYANRFAALSHGVNARAYNVISGRVRGRDIFVFDHYHETYVETEYGRRKARTHRSFVIVEGKVDLGCMEIRPKRMFDSVKRALGWGDLDLNHAEFSKRYHLTAADPELAYRLFDPRMIQFLLSQRHFAAATDCTALLIQHGGRKIAPDKIQETLQRAFAFLDRVPEDVRAERGFAQPPPTGASRASGPRHR